MQPGWPHSSGRTGKRTQFKQLCRGREPQLPALSQELFKARQQLIRAGREPGPAPASGEDASPVFLYLHSYSGWLYESESSLPASSFWETGHGLALLIVILGGRRSFSPKYDASCGSGSWSNYCCYQKSRTASEFLSRDTSTSVINESFSSRDWH